MPDSEQDDLDSSGICDLRDSRWQLLMSRGHAACSRVWFLLLLLLLLYIVLHIIIIIVIIIGLIKCRLILKLILQVLIRISPFGLLGCRA